MNTFIHRTILFWTLWILLATILGWVGFFHARIFWIFLCTSLSFFLWDFAWRYSHKKQLPKKQKKYPTSFQTFDTLFFALSSIFILINTFVFFQPQTLFSGRDQGSISQAALYLSEKHAFHFKTQESSAFFDSYGEGKALHFPGFYYDQQGNLVTQFPHPTIAWYASLLSLGIPSPFHIIVGNSITLFLSFFSFCLILFHFFKRKTVYIFGSLFLFSFPIWWFSRFSLTENVMLASLWMTLFLFVRFLETPNAKRFFLVFFSCLLLLAVRIEGPVFVLLMGIVLFFLPKTRLFFKRKPLTRIFLPATILLGFFLLTIFTNIPFFTTIAKAIFETLGLRESPELTSATIKNASFFTLWKILFLYGLGVIILSGIFGIFFLIKRKLFLKSPGVLSILFVLSPGLLYLFIPFISPDHPWMLRRFMIATLGFFILLLAYVWNNIPKDTYHFRLKKVLKTLLVLIFLSQTIPFLFFFAIRQDAQLEKQVKAFAKNFTPHNTLLLVDKSATGSGFVMLPSLFTSLGIPSVYFFNPEDFSKVKFTNFEHVYLLVEKNALTPYGKIPDTDGVHVPAFEDRRLSDTTHNASSFSFPDYIPYTIENRLLLIPQ